MVWNPRLRLPRVDDQTSSSSSAARQKRRLAGEVAVAALWRHTASNNGVATDGANDIRPASDLSGGARGALFKNALLYVLRSQLPRTWRVEGELALESIYGLHLRRDVGKRSSDIVVFDERERLVAAVSSKWTWRTDRGTEAAQMVPLRRYRPDVPYVLVTSEFPRLQSIARESVEDRVYTVCPQWAAAALVLKELNNYKAAPEEFPTLADLRKEADLLADVLELRNVSDLVSDLTNSGRLG